MGRKKTTEGGTEKLQVFLNEETLAQLGDLAAGLLGTKSKTASVSQIISYMHAFALKAGVEGKGDQRAFLPESEEIYVQKFRLAGYTFIGLNPIAVRNAYAARLQSMKTGSRPAP